MEGASISMYRGLKSFWRRRGYQRLNVGGARRRRNVVELGGGDRRRRRRFWRIRIAPKLRIIMSPKKLLIGLRDAYVRFMMRLASSPVMAGGGFGAVSYGGAFGRRPMKEYDEKMIVEIYKSLVMAQAQLVSRDALDTNSRQIACAAATQLKLEPIDEEEQFNTRRSNQEVPTH